MRTLVTLAGYLSHAVSVATPTPTVTAPVVSQTVTGTAGACGPASLPGVLGCAAGAGGLSGGGLAAFATGMQTAASDMLRGSVSWWLSVPSVDVSSEPTVAFVRDVLAFVAAALAIAGLMWAGVRMIVSRKAEAGFDVFTSLLRLVTVLGIGVAGTAILLQIGDSFSTWVLGLSGASAGVAGVSDKLATVSSMTGVTNPAMVLFLSLALFLAGGAGGLLMLLRQGALIVLVGALPLVAAGTILPSLRGWFPKVVGWLLALIFYKPVAALIYAVSFNFITGDGSLRDVVMALVMLVLAVVAFPKLMQLFTWAIPVAIQAGGRAGGTLAALGGNASAVAMQGVGGGVSALQHAALLHSDLGPSANPSGTFSPAAGRANPLETHPADTPAGAAAAAGSSAMAGNSFAARGTPAGDLGTPGEYGVAGGGEHDQSNDPGADDGTGDGSWA